MSKKKRQIHVSRPTIQKNLKECSYEPAIRVKTYDGNHPAHEVRILDDQGNVVAVVTQPKGKKLSCGARVWVSTTNPVVAVVFGEHSDEETRI